MLRPAGLGAHLWSGVWSAVGTRPGTTGPGSAVAPGIARRDPIWFGRPDPCGCG